MNLGKFEGRRGQKRLQAIRQQIEYLREEIGGMYENTPEKIFLREQIGWDEIARLHYAIALKNVHVKWDGIKDYGFIRLSCRWIKGNDLQVLSCDDVAALVKAVLPVNLADEIIEETEALEID